MDPFEAISEICTIMVAIERVYTVQCTFNYRKYIEILHKYGGWLNASVLTEFEQYRGCTTFDIGQNNILLSYYIIVL